MTPPKDTLIVWFGLTWADVSATRFESWQNYPVPPPNFPHTLGDLLFDSIYSGELRFSTFMSRQTTEPAASSPLLGEIVRATIEDAHPAKMGQILLFDSDHEKSEMHIESIRPLLEPADWGAPAGGAARGPGADIYLVRARDFPILAQIVDDYRTAITGKSPDARAMSLRITFKRLLAINFLMQSVVLGAAPGAADDISLQNFLRRFGPYTQFPPVTAALLSKTMKTLDEEISTLQKEPREASALPAELSGASASGEEFPAASVELCGAAAPSGGPPAPSGGPTAPGEGPPAPAETMVTNLYSSASPDSFVSPMLLSPAAEDDHRRSALRSAAKSAPQSAARSNVIRLEEVANANITLSLSRLQTYDITISNGSDATIHITLN